MKSRICVTLDKELIDGIKDKDLALSTVVNLLLKAFLDPTIEYRRIDVQHQPTATPVEPNASNVAPDYEKPKIDERVSSSEFDKLLQQLESTDGIPPEYEHYRPTFFVEKE